MQAPADHHLDGQNLAPFLSGRSDPQHQNEFLNHYPHPRRGQSHFFTTWREGNWKIIYQYLAKDADRYALYDLANDPSESNNVAAEQPGKLRSMMQGKVRQLKSRNAGKYPYEYFYPATPFASTPTDGLNMAITWTSQRRNPPST